jgi:hypothetical protein
MCRGVSANSSNLTAMLTAVSHAHRGTHSTVQNVSSRTSVRVPVAKHNHSITFKCSMQAQGAPEMSLMCLYAGSSAQTAMILSSCSPPSVMRIAPIAFARQMASGGTAPCMITRMSSASPSSHNVCGMKPAHRFHFRHLQTTTGLPRAPMASHSAGVLTCAPKVESQMIARMCSELLAHRHCRTASAT